MELRHLRYFVAAAEEENFARAADRLCITRPAVSQIISDLEEELGTKLFERNAHRVSLTAAGATLLSRLQRILADLGHAVEITKRVGSGKAGLLNIGYGSLTLLHPIFKAAVQKIHSEHSDVTLSLLEMPGSQQLAALRAGILHAGFIHSPASGLGPRQKSRGLNSPFDDSTEFWHFPIQTGKIAAALPIGHPLSKLVSIKLSDLANEGFIVIPVSSTSPSYGHLASLCMEAGFVARVEQEVTNIATQLHLISIGMGIGLVPMLPRLDYPSNVRIVPLRGINYATKFQLLWMKDRRIEPVLEQFIDAVRQLTKRESTSM